MQDRSRDEDPEFLAYLASETELKQHADEPLSYFLTVKIQPFTYERLKRYMESEGNPDVNELINGVLKSWLYGQGE